VRRHDFEDEEVIFIERVVVQPAFELAWHLPIIGAFTDVASHCVSIDVSAGRVADAHDRVGCGSNDTDLAMASPRGIEPRSSP
jgi:hypothetical protein